MLIGYARVSTGDQSTAAQISALEAAGCSKIFHETGSGGRGDRPELNAMVRQLRAGDVVVVWRLDRFTRSLKDLLVLLERLDAAGAGFRSLNEPIDTTTPAGIMMMHMVGAYAEFGRSMIRENTRQGLKEARAQGRVGGRPPKLDPAQRAEIAESVLSGRKKAADMARLYDVSPATVSRIVDNGRELLKQPSPS